MMNTIWNDEYNMEILLKPRMEAIRRKCDMELM